MISSLKILLIIILIVFIAYLINNLFSNLLKTLSSIFGIIETFLIFFIYHKLRIKIYGKL